MQKLRVKQALEASASQSGVLIQGWVRTRRDNKDFSFMEINDGSCLKGIQIVADAGIPGYEHIAEFATGAAAEIVGDLVESPGKGQKWEVKASSIKLIGAAPDDYPLQKKRHSDEFLRSIAHLRGRTNKFGAMFRIRSETSRAVHDFFHQNGFYYLHSPILTGSDCEGAGEMFRVTTLDLHKPLPKELDTEDFFGKEANLTVSGQLSAETYALSHGRVYTFGPTFRAENSNTARHAAEFWMIEPEAAFYDLEDNMQLGEDLLKHIIGHVRESCAEDMELFAKWVDKTLEQTLDNILNNPFERVSYTDAIDILKKAKQKFDFPVEWGIDLQTEHERFLTEKKFKKPVVVYDYPKEIKAFYMRLNDDEKTVAAMDVLVPRIGEIIGGSQREERLGVLERRIDELGLNREDYWWYMDLRRFGSAPHSGFGLGFERLLMLLTGVTNIRDVIPFPRTPNNLDF
jgi:asparaginyl-tRNA synthetase